MSAAKLREQQPAIEALAELADACTDLPGAYLVLSKHSPGVIMVQADSHEAFEGWREALRIAPAEVVLDDLGLEFSGPVAGVTARVYLAMQVLTEAVAS